MYKLTRKREKVLAIKIYIPNINGFQFNKMHKSTANTYGVAQKQQIGIMKNNLVSGRVLVGLEETGHRDCANLMSYDVAIYLIILINYVSNL